MNRIDERAEWVEFFKEVDIEQRLPEGPIPSDVWIPTSREDVKSYIEKHGKQKTEEEEIQGNLLSLSIVSTIPGCYNSFVSTTIYH